MEKVRVGIIGTGGIAQGHIQRLLAHPAAEITALCDTSSESLAHTVERYPQLKGVATFQDYKELIRSGLVDAVNINTPHTAHFEQIMAALEAGLHVLTEKPMVCTVEHAHQVLKQVEKSGKVLVVSYQRHYMSEFLYIRDQIAAGRYGPVQFVQAFQSQNWYRGTKGKWRQDPALSGGGQLNDSGSHLVAVILFMTNLPAESVFGYIENFDSPVDINSALSLRFSGGALANISVVGNAPTWHEDITICCDQGVFFLRNGRLEVCGPDGKRFTPTAEEMPKGSDPDTNFINAILGKEPVGSPAIWGLRVMELTEAAWKSAEEGRPIEVKHL
jgi:predicted dehydrogenase